MARKCAVPPYDRTSPEQYYTTVFVFSVNYQGLNLGRKAFDTMLLSWQVACSASMIL